MNPSFLGKAFPSFIFTFHQKVIFCCRNDELGSVVILTQSKQGPALAPHTNTIQGAPPSSLGSGAEGGVQCSISVLSAFQMFAPKGGGGGGGGTDCGRQHLGAQPLVAVLHAGWHRVFSPGQQQLAVPHPCARRRHKCFGG